MLLVLSPRAECVRPHFCRTGGAGGLAAGSKSDAGAIATIRLRAVRLLRDALSALVRPSPEVLAAQRQLRQAQEVHAAAERRREELRAQGQQEQGQQRPAEAITQPEGTGQGGSHAEGAVAGAAATGVAAEAAATGAAEGGAGAAAMDVDAPEQATQQMQQEKQQQQQAGAAAAPPAPDAAPDAAEVREEPPDVEATAAAVEAAAAALATAEADHARTSRPHASLLLRCRLALACHALRRAVVAARAAVSYNASVAAAVQAAGDLRHATAEFYPLLKELRACCGSTASAADPAADADAEGGPAQGLAVPPACLPWLRQLQRRLVAWLCALQHTVAILEPPTTPGTGAAGATGAAAAAGGAGVGAGGGAAHGPGGHGRLSSRHNTVRALRMVMVEACGGVLCAWRLDPTAARGPAECCALLQVLTAALCCGRPGLPAAIAAGQCAAAASGAPHATAAAGTAGQAAVAGSAQAAGAGAGAGAQGQQAAGATNPTADLLPFLREALDLLEPHIAQLAGHTPTTTTRSCRAMADAACARPPWHPAAPSDTDMRRASTAAVLSPARLPSQPQALQDGGAGAGGGDQGAGREGGGGGGCDAICVEPSRWPGLMALHVLRWREGEEEDEEDKDSSGEEGDDERQGGKGQRSGAGGGEGKGGSNEGVEAGGEGLSRDERPDDAAVQAVGGGEGGAAAVDAVAHVDAPGEEQQHQQQQAHRLTMAELEGVAPMDAAVAVWRALERGPATAGVGEGGVAGTQVAAGGERGHEARLVLLQRLSGAQAQLLWLMHGVELPWRDQAWGTGLPSGTVGANEQRTALRVIALRKSGAYCALSFAPLAC